MAGMWRNLGREKVLALCGQGNSGGDGLAVAGRLLLLHPELDLRVVLFAGPGALSGDVQTNWRMLKARTMTRSWRRPWKLGVLCSPESRTLHSSWMLPWGQR